MAKHTIAEAMLAVVEAYPMIFKGRIPNYPENMPAGWALLVSQLCLLLESMCSLEQLQDTEISALRMEHGALEFDIDYACELSVDRKELIEARVFALGSRSVYSCIICGILVKEWPIAGRPILCEKHT